MVAAWDGRGDVAAAISETGTPLAGRLRLVAVDAASSEIPASTAAIEPQRGLQ